MLEKSKMSRLRMMLPRMTLLACASASLVACGDGGTEGPSQEQDASTLSPHDQVSAILGAGPEQRGTCSIASCHGDPAAEGIASAGLNLKKSADLTELLVGKKSCEAPALNLVEPGDPDKSWLYIKLTGATKTGSKDLEPDPSWGEPGEDCEEATGFGKRMPETGAALSAAQVETIKQWILDGAPGPD
jgi:hypothetical protein